MSHNIQKIIKNTLSRLYVQEVATRKGWTPQETENKIVEFLTTGKSTSLFDFLENA